MPSTRTAADDPTDLSDFVRRHLDAAIGTEGMHEIAEAFGLGSEDDAPGFMFARPEPNRTALPDSLLLVLVDALAALSPGDAGPYLELPSAKRQVLRSSIEEHGIEGAQRLCIELGSRDAS